MKENIFRAMIFTFSVVGILMLVFPVTAQITQFDKCGDLGIECGEGGSVQFIINVITNIVNILLAIVGLIAAIFVVWGGFQYVTSGGDEGKAESGKKTILYAVVGLLIIGLSAAIVNFVVAAIKGSL